MAELLQAIKMEMALRHDYISPPDTLYIGGGTPSLYGADELGGVVEEAKRVWGGAWKEVTVELNPEDVTLDYCRALLDWGINRVSMGIQSFFDEHLKFMHRRHNARQGVRAIEAARKAGFTNVSFDLIFGFPGLSCDQWRNNVVQAISLAPEHLSVYQLGIEPGTHLFRMVQRGLLSPVEEEEAANQYALLQELLPIAGLKQYEVSNFARDGYRSMHNSAYWQGVPYLGIGPSAHSFNGRARHAHVRHIGRYLKGVRDWASGVQPSAAWNKVERLSNRKRYNEFVMTRLRTVEGFNRKTFEQQGFNKSFLRHFEQVSALGLQMGQLEELDGNISIPLHKLFVSDGIIRELMV